MTSTAGETQYQSISRICAGVDPLPETYTTLMVAMLAEGNITKAEQVLQSVSRTNVPVFPCWSLLVSGLFKQGYVKGTALLTCSRSLQG